MHFMLLITIIDLILFTFDSREYARVFLAQSRPFLFAYYLFLGKQKVEFALALLFTPLRCHWHYFKLFFKWPANKQSRREGGGVARGDVPNGNAEISIDWPKREKCVCGFAV